MPYDPQNIFARILRGEVACDFIYEDAYAVSFYDVSPQSRVHALVIPKGAYVSFDDFSREASDADIVGFFKAVQKTIGFLDVRSSGYRLIANHGLDGGQEVPHFHMHILAGEIVGPIRTKAS